MNTNFQMYFILNMMHLQKMWNSISPLTMHTIHLTTIHHRHFLLRRYHVNYHHSIQPFHIYGKQYQNQQHHHGRAWDTLLQQALSAEKEGNLDKRDELFVQFMLLPRRYLNRVPKQRNAARQLAKHLHHQHSSLSQPQQTQTSLHSHQQQQQVQQRRTIPETNNIPVPDADAFAAQKATRLVREGHVRRAVTALLSTPSPLYFKFITSVASTCKRTIPTITSIISRCSD